MLSSKFISYYCLHYIIPIYHITEVLIFYADKLMVMGNSTNLHVFNFAVLLKLRKFDAREIYRFYSKLVYFMTYFRTPISSIVSRVR